MCLFYTRFLDVKVVRHAWAGKCVVNEANRFVIIVRSFFYTSIISSQFSML